MAQFPPGVWSRWGWKGPSEDRDTQLRPGDQLQGDRGPVESGRRDGRAAARRAHQAEALSTRRLRDGNTQGTPGTPGSSEGPTLPVGTPTGDCQVWDESCLGMPTPPCWGQEGCRRAGGHCRQEGRGQEGGGTSHLLTKPPPPPPSGRNALSHSYERSSLLEGRRGTQSHSTPGLSVRSLKLGSLPDRAHPPRHPSLPKTQGETRGDQTGNVTPQSTPRPHLATGLTS